MKRPTALRVARCASPEAIARWNALSPTQQAASLAWVVKRIRSSPRAALRQLGTGVTRVAFGRRERRVKASRAGGAKGKPRRLDEMVLLVFVGRKWGSAGPPDAHSVPVPPEIEVRVPVKQERASASGSGRRRGESALDWLRRVRRRTPTTVRERLAIPTDVRTPTPIPKAQAGPDEQVLHVSGTGATMAGCASLLVRESVAGSPLAVLGCHHVLWRSKKMPKAARDAASAAVATDGTSLGVPSPAVNLRPAPAPGNIDAALLVQSGAGDALVRRGSFWRWTEDEHPGGYVESEEEFMSVLNALGETPYLYPPARAGAPRRIALKFLEMEDNHPIRYELAVVNIAQVAIFQPASATEGGYSGGPVLAGNLFLGIHLAGLKSPLRSYVLPAYQILPSGIEGLDLKLATDVIDYSQ